jgi:hypothetical protein
MQTQEIERILGLTPGPTLLALAELAKKLRRKSPSAAFEVLSFVLPWLKTESERTADRLLTEEVLKGLPDWHRRSLLGVYLGTPYNVLPFAHTGGNTDHFGFLIEREKPVEDLAIVRVLPSEPDEATQIVAPNLRDFLGLLAISSGFAISREATDEEWFLFRKEWFGDDPKRIAEMEAVSNALCDNVPGVRRPSRPSQVATAFPATRFMLTVPYSDPSRAKLVVSDMERARVAAVRAARLLSKGEFSRVVALAEVGMRHLASHARCLYLRGRALTRLGRSEEAWTAVDELANAWLDDVPVVPPAVHARRAVAREELIELLRESNHPASASLSERVRSAGEIHEAGGDFL